MRLVFGILAALFSWLLPLTALSLGISTPEHQQALKIQELIFNRQYAAAESLLASVKTSSNSPLPTLVRMTISQLKMAENFTFEQDGSFASQSATNEALCDKLSADEASGVWDLMLCGASEALRSFFHLKNGSSFKAIGYAKRSIDLFETVMKKDPTNPDAPLCAAMYDYFKSEFTQTKLSFLPFFSDKRGDALSVIRGVSSKGVFARNLADFSLALIAMETQQKALGEQVFPKLIGKFDGSVLFRVMDAAFFTKVGEYEKARNVLTDVLKRAPEITVAKYFIGRAYAVEGKDLAAAKTWLNDYLATDPDKSVKGPALFHLGLAIEKGGDKIEAQRLYQLAYDTYPPYKPAFKNLMRLKNEDRNR
jgi:tetratricopeptide (TPR) repeat protein